MPWHISQDLIHFRNYTLGKPVIYGRRTLESMGTAFKRRRNIVLSRSSAQVEQGVSLCGSIEEALQVAGKAKEKLNSPDIIIAGGGQIYKEFMQLANKLVITHVLVDAKGDVKFPDINADKWDETDRSDILIDDHSKISFYKSVYKKKH